MKLKEWTKSRSFRVLLYATVGILYGILFYYILLIFGVEVPLPFLIATFLLFAIFSGISFEREIPKLQKIAKMDPHPKYGFAGWPHVIREFKKGFRFGFVAGVIYGLVFCISRISKFMVEGLLFTVLLTFLIIILGGIVFGILLGIFLAVLSAIKIGKGKQEVRF